jgi:cytoskeletal protein CcmA (bactofilin family)
MNAAVRLLVFGVALLAVGWPGAAAIAQSEASAGPENDVFVGDLYEAGGSVRVSRAVDGDVVIAGGTLNVSESVSQDVIAAGGLVTIAADTGDDLRLAGGIISITGSVGSDAIASGGMVTLDAASTVRGRAQLAGRMVNVYGNVDGDLSVTGGQITLTGRVGGNVRIDAESIEIEPDAVIVGNLTYASPKEVVVAEGATIEGEIERVEYLLGEAETAGEATKRKLKTFFGLVLSATVLFLLLPQFTVTVLRHADRSLLKTLALGLAVLASVPVVILVMLFSSLASALTFVVLGLYLALLFGGWLIGVLWIGDLSMNLLGRTPGSSKWARVGSVVLAALVLLALGSIPYVEFLSVFLTTLLGIGATSLHLHKLYTR